MDNLLIFKIISLLLSILVILYSLRTISKTKVRILFIIMIASFFLSTILFFPEGRINDWMKHLPFYVGQLFFYFFLSSLLSEYTPPNNSVPSPKPIVPTTQIAASFIGSGIDEWFNFLTDQGLQHFLAVPLFLLVMMNIQIHFPSIKDAIFRRILTIFLIAGTCLTMIHLGEFIVEAQDWMPFLEGNPIEIIEFIWYYSAVILFIFGLHILHSRYVKVTELSSSL